MKSPTPTVATAAAGTKRSKTDTMKAIVKAKPGPGAEIREVPIPSCAPGKFLRRFLRAGVCGTDLPIYKWDGWSESRLKPPLTIGHEFVGEIVEMGGDVSDFSSGQRVSCESHLIC